MGANLVSPVMVGRAAPLATLRRLADLAGAGSPAVVLLGGEAGIGKTRLITEFTAGLDDRALLLSGGCVDVGGADLAYGPFTAALPRHALPRGQGNRAAARRGPDLLTGSLESTSPSPRGAAAELRRILTIAGASVADAGLAVPNAFTQVGPDGLADPGLTGQLGAVLGALVQAGRARPAAA